MDIQPIGSNKFIVGLDREDMARLDITYEEMDYSNVETKRVIWTIIDAIRKDTGKDIDPSGNLVIEVAPDIAGGCFMLLTVLSGGRKTVVSKTGSTCVFEFANIDNVLDAMSSAKLSLDRVKIYSCREKYRLEIPAEIYERVSRVLSEYGYLAGKDKLTASMTREHWQQVLFS